jgi:hypothetical protein
VKHCLLVAQRTWLEAHKQMLGQDGPQLQGPLQFPLLAFLLEQLALQLHQQQRFLVLL